MQLGEIISLGSVVKLKGFKEKVIVIGLNPTLGEETFDYCGCVFPFGYTGKDEVVSFNHDKVEKVVFKGYYDEEAKGFFEDILWLREQKENKENKAKEEKYG